MLRMTASLLTSLTTQRQSSLRSSKTYWNSFFSAQQIAQVLDNLSSALDVLDDVNQDVAELVEGGVGGLQEPPGGLGVGQDPGRAARSTRGRVKQATAPIVETRVQCASSWRLRWASISARFRSVMSVCAITAPSPDRPRGTTDSVNQRSPSAIRLTYSEKTHRAPIDDCARGRIKA